MGKLIEVLAYGAIGVGFVLAMLTFKLLQLEQKVSKPRRSMIRSIYVYMAFSLVLTAFGFTAEFLKQPTASYTVLNFPQNGDAQDWDEIVSATRQTLFQGAKELKLQEIKVVEGNSEALNFRLEPGRCIRYWLIVRPPAEIAIGDLSDPAVRNVIDVQLGHMVHGRLCRGKVPLPLQPVVELKFSLKKGSGSVIAEAYYDRVFGSGSNDPT